MKVPKLKLHDMLVFKQKKHGKSGINKLHYTIGKSHSNIYQGKYLNKIFLYKKSDPCVAASNVFTTD
jgi:hypothetical protein